MPPLTMGIFISAGIGSIGRTVSHQEALVLRIHALISSLVAYYLQASCKLARNIDWLDPNSEAVQARQTKPRCCDSLLARLLLNVMQTAIAYAFADLIIAPLY